MLIARAIKDSYSSGIKVLIYDITKQTKKITIPIELGLKD